MDIVMDCKIFIVEVLKVTIWPLTLLTIAFTFKNQLKKLLESISEVRFSKFNIKLTKEILANNIRKANKEAVDNEMSNSSLTKEDIYNISDDDFEFMIEISANKNYMPKSKSEVYKYNSLVSHGYFSLSENGVYKPTDTGLEILANFKSMYHGT